MYAIFTQTGRRVAAKVKEHVEMYLFCPFSDLKRARFDYVCKEEVGGLCKNELLCLLCPEVIITLIEPTPASTSTILLIIIIFCTHFAYICHRQIV